MQPLKTKTSQSISPDENSMMQAIKRIFTTNDITGCGHILL